MVKGNDAMRRNMTLLMNKIANDIASDIASKINSAEPAFQAKAERRDGDEISVRAVVKGRAELSDTKDSKIDQIINNAIKNTVGES